MRLACLTTHRIFTWTEKSVGRSAVMQEESNNLQEDLSSQQGSSQGEGEPLQMEMESTESSKTDQM